LIAQQGGQYLNCDVPADRTLILNKLWSPQAPLLVLEKSTKCTTRKPGSKACSTANLPPSNCWLRAAPA
jgi:hypothetical protein